MVPSSLFDCFFLCVCCLRVLCRPLKVRQIDAKGPRIYQMELSDYLRFFSSCSLAHRRIHPRGEQRGVPIRPSPKLINLFFFLTTRKS